MGPLDHGRGCDDGSPACIDPYDVLLRDVYIVFWMRTSQVPRRTRCYLWCGVGFYPSSFPCGHWVSPHPSTPPVFSLFFRLSNPYVALKSTRTRELSIATTIESTPYRPTDYLPLPMAPILPPTARLLRHAELPPDKPASPEPAEVTLAPFLDSPKGLRTSIKARILIHLKPASFIKDIIAVLDL